MSRVDVEDRELHGPHGPLPVRIYRPSEPDGSALVWAHGGAFVHGDLDMPEADHVARTLADAGTVVVSVGYRLSPPLDPPPGTPTPADPVRFPVASEELTAAFDWTVEHATALEADPARVALGGTSAGGNLAAGAAMRLRDRGGVAPSTLLLLYPLLHAVLPAPSAELAATLDQVAAERRFPDEGVRLINLNYVGDPAALDSPYAFPGGHDLAGLPPTLVLNSDRDSLRSSGEAFAAELARAGVDVSLVREDGTFHGHLNTPDDPGCARSLERMRDWLQVFSPGLATHPAAPPLSR